MKNFDVTALRNWLDCVKNFYDSLNLENLKELCEFFGKTFFVTGVITVVAARQFIDGTILVILSLLFLAIFLRR